MFEKEESKREELIKELVKGKKSGSVKEFNRESFVSKLHEKYAKK